MSRHPLFPWLLAIGLVLLPLTSCHQQPGAHSGTDRDIFIRDLKHRTFDFFWDRVDPHTWQTDDRYPTVQFSSIAATGFGLAAYPVGIANGYITRQQGAERVRNTLEWLWHAAQGPDAHGVSGYRGFFYHFLNYGSGTRFKTNELSTIDTGLLMAGILTAQSWFDSESADETRIRQLADSLYLRVEWDWAMNGGDRMSMGWHPESGFLESAWSGYNEAMILMILAMGSPSHPVTGTTWKVWCSTYEWENFGGFDFVNFSPLFGHQYSHMFIDFRGIEDAYMREKGIDYFENSRRATLANRQYCIQNPVGFTGYSRQVWGLTACDGPANEKREINGREVTFQTYSARGASALYINDDGTIAPTAAGGSIPFAPDVCLNSLYAMKLAYGDKLYQRYGFKDAFNPTYTYGKDMPDGWFDVDYLGIDQGPILIQLENYQTGLVWNALKRNPYIRAGLLRAGFSGGWLNP